MEELNSSTLISEEIENEEEQTSEENVQEEIQEEEPVVETEETDEEPQGKFYTDEEFNQKVNEIADRRVARKMRKINRELEKYRDTENVLKSQLGGETIEEVNSNLRKLYTDEGVNLPDKYISEDKEYVEYQATRDSEDIIAEGYQAIKDEANRLASFGYENLSSKDKLIFTKLCDALDHEEDVKILKGLNVDTSILEDKDFIKYREQFNRNVPVSKIYEMYSGVQEKTIKTPGSLSNNTKVESEFFTDEEIENLTDADLDDPVIWEKLRRTQTRQK